MKIKVVIILLVFTFGFASRGLGNENTSGTANLKHSKSKYRDQTFRHNTSSRYLPLSLRFSDSTAMQHCEKFLRSLGHDSTAHFHRRGLTVTLSRGLWNRYQKASKKDNPDFESELKNRGISVESETVYKADYLPGDEKFEAQWNLYNKGQKIADFPPGLAGKDIGMPQVWENFSGAESLVVAVIDAGINFLHPEFVNRIWHNQAEKKGLPGIDDDNNGYIDDTVGWDFVENDAYPMDYIGHGSAVSGVIAANMDNNVGIAGILAEGKIMPVRVLSAAGYGQQDIVAKGILYAVNNGADVINLSLGSDSKNEKLLENAVKAAEAKGIPVIFSAGNDGVNWDLAPVYPFLNAGSNVITVASHNDHGNLSEFSNFGKKSVHIAAPGEAILTCGTPDGEILFEEDFETSLDKWSQNKPSDFLLSSSDPLKGKQSLTSVQGNSVSIVTKDYLDLRGRVGTVLKLLLEYQPGSRFDALIIEGNIKGSSQWTEIGVSTSPISSNELLAFALLNFENKEVRLRVRLSSPVTVRNRVFKMDAFRMEAYNPKAPTHEVYIRTSGTSLSAPHVSAYAALFQLACQRKGIAFSRDSLLMGLVTEASLSVKLSSGGRLNIAKGLRFYLEDLPSLSWTDSTHSNWNNKEQVSYSLQVNPNKGSGYQISILDLPPGANFQTSSALLSWVGPQLGQYGIHAKAVGETTLRHNFSFTVEAFNENTVSLLPGLNSKVLQLDRSSAVNGYYFSSGFRDIKGRQLLP